MADPSYHHDEHGVITFWPRIGDTETLYSIAARLHYLRGGASMQRTSQWLFGFPTAGSLRFSPRNLDHFVSVTEGLLGPAINVFKERTPAGQFAPFVTPQAWASWSTWCRALPSENKPFTALRNYGLPTRSPLRACPQCATSDRLEFGSSIWRLEHQLLGTFVCIWHGDSLVEEVCQLKRDGDSANSWVRPEDCFEREQFQPCVTNPQEIGYWLGVAKANWCLYVHPRTSGIQLREIVRLYLSHLGVVPTGKRLDPECLRQWWNSIKRPCFLGQQSLHSFEDADWIRRLLLKRSHDHPLRWAVLCSAVLPDGALYRALTDATPLQMTLNGKWAPFLKSREDLLKPQVWTALIDGAKIADISSRFGIPTAQLRHALRLNPLKQKIRVQRTSFLDRDSRRERVSRFSRENPSATRSDLLHALPADLRWLELHDACWIAGQLRHLNSLKFRQAAFDFSQPSLSS